MVIEKNYEENYVILVAPREISLVLKATKAARYNHIKTTKMDINLPNFQFTGHDPG